MRILQIVPGTGGAFYCENCVRDITLIKSLKDMGHDVVVVPMYLPLLSDDPSVSSDTPVFFGAVNTYLKQRYAFFRKLPRWVDRVFDTPPVLNWAAQKAGSMRADGLEETTLAILMGESGPHARELDNLIAWIGENFEPDVVHLSNALLVGMAKRLKEKLKAPIVCSLQDEHAWVDATPEQARKRIWQVLTERADDVDVFVAVSRYYAELASQRMHIRPDRMRVVSIGIEPHIFHEAPLSFDPPTIGFVSRLSESLGLGALVEAFIRLKSEAGLKTLRLRVTGGQTGDDVNFVASLRKRLADLRIEDDVDFILDFDRKRRLDFLQSLSVFCVPAADGLAFGLPMIEALASGVPIVQPDAGAARELMDVTGGGILYESGNMEQLVDALRSLLLAPERARQMAREARPIVLEEFNSERMTRRMIEVYVKAGSKR